MSLPFVQGIGGTNQSLTIDGSQTSQGPNDYNPKVDWDADAGYSGTVTFIGSNNSGTTGGPNGDITVYSGITLRFPSAGLGNTLINTDLIIIGNANNQGTTRLSLGNNGGEFNIRSLSGTITATIIDTSNANLVLGTNNTTTNTTTYAGFMSREWP